MQNLPEQSRPTWRADELETVACDQCASPGTIDILVRPDGLRVVECKKCGVCYVSPRPKRPLITRLYHSDYYTKGDETAHQRNVGYRKYFSEETKRSLLETGKAKLGVLKRHIQLDGAECLEVGCASGEVSHLLSKQGARVVGIDISGSAIEQAKSRYPGIEFHAIELDLLPQKHFDALLAFEVIEHVPQPSEFFNAAAARLKPDGLLVLTTPNYACAKLIGADNWLGFKTSFEHLYFFDPVTLSQCGARAGFTTVEWFTKGDDGRFHEDIVVEQVRGPRFLAKRLLRQLRLLSLARAIRKSFSTRTSTPEQHGYERHGNGHNLMMIFRKNRPLSQGPVKAL
jgi:2-polyprenyl-3-methyl-5-hydroxy-6-metoxy-1,4-benzoquinol methylase